MERHYQTIEEQCETEKLRRSIEEGEDPPIKCGTFRPRSEIPERVRRKMAFDRWESILQSKTKRPTPQENIIGLAVIMEEHYELRREARDRGDDKEADQQEAWRKEIERQLVDAARAVWRSEIS